MNSILAPEEVNALLRGLVDVEPAGERCGPWGESAVCSLLEPSLSVVFQAIAAPAAGLRSAERGN